MDARFMLVALLRFSFGANGHSLQTTSQSRSLDFHALPLPVRSRVYPSQLGIQEKLSLSGWGQNLVRNAYASSTAFTTDDVGPSVSHKLRPQRIVQDPCDTGGPTSSVVDALADAQNTPVPTGRPRLSTTACGFGRPGGAGTGMLSIAHRSEAPGPPGRLSNTLIKIGFLTIRRYR